MSTLVEMFKHNLWANQRLLDACAALSEAQLEAGAAGTYGRIADTLIHLLGAEARYVAIFTGRPPERPLRHDQPFPGAAALRAHAQASGQALIDIAASDPFGQVLRATFQGQEYDLPAYVPLLQAINHATEHRAHINTVLSQLGLEPVNLDGWTYDEARNA